MCDRDHNPVGPYRMARPVCCPWKSFIRVSPGGWAPSKGGGSGGERAASPGDRPGSVK